MPDTLSEHHAARLRDGLQRAANTPFPASPAAPDERFAWDFYQEFLVDAPRRLTTLIEAEYFDPEQSSTDDEDYDITLQLQFEALFKAVVDSVTAHYGQAPITEVDYALFDSELFNFDIVKVAYWNEEDRLVVVHYAVQFGDGDLQLSVVLCAVPNDKPPTSAETAP